MIKMISVVAVIIAATVSRQLTEMEEYMLLVQIFVLCMLLLLRPQLCKRREEQDRSGKQLRDGNERQEKKCRDTIDLRESHIDDVELEPGHNYILRWTADGYPLASPLDVFVSTPKDPTEFDTLLYFHGYTEDYDKAPTEKHYCTIAVGCPDRLHGEETALKHFWFHVGTEKAWEKFDYKNLHVSCELLEAVSAAVSATRLRVEKLRQGNRLRNDLPPIKILGSSMGACAALEYSAFRPDDVAALAIVGGYFNPDHCKSFSRAAQKIPMLVVHFVLDDVCRFEPLRQHFFYWRLWRAKARTDSWILPGRDHCGSERLRRQMIDWLLEIKKAVI
jgi:hypothetical protein